MKMKYKRNLIKGYKKAIKALIQKENLNIDLLDRINLLEKQLQEIKKYP